MQNLNHSWAHHKNFHHFHGTPLQLICSSGKLWFLMVADMFSRYIIVRKLPNSTSTAMCIELSMIVTELGLPHIIRRDNGSCNSSKEFHQFLQCYSIMRETSSPNHPRSYGFTDRMVGVANKLMDKAGSEGKLDFRSV